MQPETATGLFTLGGIVVGLVASPGIDMLRERRAARARTKLAARLLLHEISYLGRAMTTAYSLGQPSALPDSHSVQTLFDEFRDALAVLDQDTWKIVFSLAKLDLTEMRALPIWTPAAVKQVDEMQAIMNRAIEKLEALV